MRCIKANKKALLLSGVKGARHIDCTLEIALSPMRSDLVFLSYSGRVILFIR